MNIWLTIFLLAYIFIGTVLASYVGARRIANNQPYSALVVFTLFAWPMLLAAALGVWLSEQVEAADKETTP